MLKDNLHQVQQNIKAACDRAHRNYSDVTLIAVSKTKPASAIEEAIAAGQRALPHRELVGGLCAACASGNHLLHDPAFAD